MTFMLAGCCEDITRADVAGFVGFGAAVLFIFGSAVVWILAAVVRAFASAIRSKRNPQLGDQDFRLSRRAEKVLVIVFLLNLAAVIPVYHVARQVALESGAEPIAP